MTRRSLPTLLVALLSASLTMAQEREAPTVPLLSRSYALAPLPGGYLAVGSSFGITLYRQPETATGQATTLPPITDGSLLLPGSVTDLVAHGDTLYAAMGPSGIAVARFDGTQIRELSRFDTPGAAMGLAVADDHLYVAMGVLGVAVYDASRPPRLSLSQVVPTEGYCRRLHLETREGRPDRLLAANGHAGLVIIHFDEAGAIASMQSLALPGDVRWAGLRNGELFVSLGSAGFCSLSAGRDSASSRVCIPVTDVARCAVPLEDTVIVSDGSDGLLVVDWPADAQPAVRMRVETPFSANALLVINGMLISALDAGGVVVWDWATVVQNRQ